MFSYLTSLLTIIIQYIANRLLFTPKKSKNKPLKPSIKNIKIKSRNQKLIDTICCYPKNYADDKIIIFSHGNTTINEHQQDYLLNLSEELNIRVVGYDYQGYGHSQGSSSEQNCYEDHESVVEYFKLTNPNSTIYLMGRSLGTGIVVDYISKHEWNDLVILISPYESMLNIITNEGSILWRLFKSYDRFDSKSKIKNITCPVKIFHGKDDSLVNISHAKNLYELLLNKKYKPVWIDNCDHKRIFDKLPVNEIKEVFN